jgi:hypothetical protein
VTPQTKPYKAILAFVFTFLGTLVATVQGRTDLDTMRVIDWAIVVVSAIVTAGGVYQITNPPAPPQA